MAGLPGIVVRVTAETAAAVKDIGKFNKALGDQATAAEKFQAGLGRITPAATVAFGAVAAGATIAAKAAIEQEDQIGALVGVYGNASDAALDYADSAYQLGLSTSDYAQQSALLGNALTGLGATQGEAVEQSNQLIEASAAMAAQFGQEVGPTVDSVSAALRGEYDSIQKLIPGISGASVEAKALELSQKAAASALTEADKAAAVQALVMEGAAGSLANFDEQSDSAAFKQQEMKAQLSNVTAELGTALMPAIQGALDVGLEFAEWASENTDLLLALTAVVAGVSGAILVLNVALKVYNVISKAFKVIQIAATAAQWAFNVAMLANPVVLITVAIIALIAIIAALVYIFRKQLVDALKKAWDWIKKVANYVRGAFSAAFDWVSGKIQAAVEWVRRLIDKVKELLSNPIGGILDAVGLGGASVQANTTTAVVAARSNTPTTVNVHTVADSETTAREIQRVLNRSAWRNGRQLPVAGAW